MFNNFPKPPGNLPLRKRQPDTEPPADERTQPEWLRRLGQDEVIEEEETPSIQPRNRRTQRPTVDQPDVQVDEGEEEDDESPGCIQRILSAEGVTAALIAFGLLIDLTTGFRFFKGSALMIGFVLLMIDGIREARAGLRDSPLRLISFLLNVLAFSFITISFLTPGEAGVVIVSITVLALTLDALFFTPLVSLRRT